MYTYNCEYVYAYVSIYIYTLHIYIYIHFVFYMFRTARDYSYMAYLLNPCLVPSYEFILRLFHISDWWLGNP